MDFLHWIMTTLGVISDFLWGSLIVYLLIAVGIFFAIFTKFAQIGLFAKAVKVLSVSNKNTTHHLSSFQSLATSLASLIGTGSIAGMAIAISNGGPGAIFWIWVVAIFGMVLSLVENTLGQVYKKNINNKFVGGPAYYISEGLKSKTFAVVFSIALLFTYGIVFNTVQANTIGSSLLAAFNFNIQYTAIALTVLTAIVVVGGVKRIAQAATVLLPIMGITYIGLALLVIVTNLSAIPGVFVLIFKSAFGLNEIVYGVTGGALLQVFIIAAKRALFASESGLGSMPNITASAYVKHPIEQGLIGMISVFIIAFIVCTATAIIVITGGLYTGELKGIALVQQSLVNLLGHYSTYILLISVFIFGFTSIIGNYAYAESNIMFLSAKYSKIYLNIIKILLLVAVYFGTILPLSSVWSLADFASGLMVIINVTALILLSKVFFGVLKDYKEQLAKTVTPEFKASKINNLPAYTKEIWK